MAEHKKWSPEEDAELERLYADPSLQLKEIVLTLGRHRNQVIRRARKLGLALASSTQWSEAAEQVLKDHVGDKGILWCAKMLGKTEEAVRMKARYLELRTADARRNLWTEEEDRYIVEKRSAGFGYHEIGEALGRTQEATRYRHKVIRGVISRRQSAPEGFDVVDMPEYNPEGAPDWLWVAHPPWMQTPNGRLLERYIRGVANVASAMTYDDLCNDFRCSRSDAMERLTHVCGDALKRKDEGLPRRQGWSLQEKGFLRDHGCYFYPYELQRVLFRTEESIVRMLWTIVGKESDSLAPSLRPKRIDSSEDSNAISCEELSAIVFTYGYVKAWPITLIAERLSAHYNNTTYSDIKAAARKRLAPEQYKEVFGRKYPPFFSEHDCNCDLVDLS